MRKKKRIIFHNQDLNPKQRTEVAACMHTRKSLVPTTPKQNNCTCIIYYWQKLYANNLCFCLLVSGLFCHCTRRKCFEWERAICVVALCKLLCLVCSGLSCQIVINCWGDNTRRWFGLGVSLDQQELVKNITNPHIDRMINEFYNFRVCLIKANSRVFWAKSRSCATIRTHRQGPNIAFSSISSYHGFII